MDKIKKPKNMSELLTTNKISKKAHEKVIMPKVDTDFDKQQAERFRASANNFTAWNMELRRELNELEPEIFDKWKESYGDQLQIDWKKGTDPKEAAAAIAKLHRAGGNIRKKKGN